MDQALDGFRSVSEVVYGTTGTREIACGASHTLLRAPQSIPATARIHNREGDSTSHTQKVTIARHQEVGPSGQCRG